MESLRSLTRRVIHAIESTDIVSAEYYVNYLRERFKLLGLHPGCHEGLVMNPGDDYCVEWYAGQLIKSFDSKNYYVVNSIINLLDKFCPAGLNDEEYSLYLQLKEKYERA